MLTLDRFHNHLTVVGDLVAVTALRVGAGKSTSPVGSDLPVLRDALDRPYIPGSTFKGVLRSYLESRVRAVVPGPRGACNPTSEAEWCISAQTMKGWRDELQGWPPARRDPELADRVAQASCLLCLTFGSPWLASHVQIKDLLVDATLWFGQYQVRNGVAIDRDTETAAEHLLYDYEVVPAETRFRLEIVAENLEPWQLGLLVLGLKAFEDGDLAVGGFKSRGLGRVKLAPGYRGTFVDVAGDADALIAYLQNPAKAGQDMRERANEWVAALKEELKRRAAPTPPERQDDHAQATV